MSIFLISWTNIGTSLHHLTTPKQHEISSKLKLKLQLHDSSLHDVLKLEHPSPSKKASLSTNSYAVRWTSIWCSRPAFWAQKNIQKLIFNLMIKQSILGKCCFVRLIPYWWEFPTCDCSEKSVKKLKMLSSIWPRTRHLQKRVSPTDTCPLDTNSNGNEQFSFLGKIIPKTAEKEIKPTCIEFWDIAFVVFEAKEGMIHDVWLIQEILQLIGGSLLVPCSQPWYTNQLMRSSSFTGPLNHLFPWLLRT